MKQRTQWSIMLLMIGLAIILAAGLFLAVSVIRNRPDTQEGAETVMVEGQQVSLQRNPNTTVSLVSPTELLVEETQPVVVTDAQPEEAVPTETPVPQETVNEPPPEPTATAVPDKIIFIDYTVQKNDTLYSVTQRIDTSIALMARHNIAQDNLVPDTVLKLPIGNPDYCPGRRAYAVGEGDTAFSIGQKFNITAQELQSINQLDEQFTVRVADIICVP